MEKTKEISMCQAPPLNPLQALGQNPQDDLGVKEILPIKPSVWHRETSR